MDKSISNILLQSPERQKQFIENNLNWYLETLDVQGSYIIVLAKLLSHYKTKQDVIKDYKLSMIEYFCNISAAHLDATKFQLCSTVESLLEAIKEK